MTGFLVRREGRRCSNSVQPLPRKAHNSISYFDAVNEDSNDSAMYVLLHGLGNSLDFWSVVAPELSRHGRTVALDIPGFGRSQPNRRYGLDEAAKKINGLLLDIEVRNAVLVGHSLGAIVAMRVSALRPDLFVRVVLVAGTLGRVARIVRHPWTAIGHPQLAAAVAAQFVGAAVHVRPRLAQLLECSTLVRMLTLWPYVAHPPRLLPGVLATALADNGGPQAVRALAEGRRTDFASLLSGVPCAVDLVWGGSDRLISSDDLKEAARLASVERMTEIDNCGHWPMLERPYELAEFILRRARRDGTCCKVEL